MFHQRLSLAYCIALLLTSCGAILAQPTQPTTTNAELDRARFEFDKQRFAAEQENEARRLAAENVKTYLSAVSIIVPILAVELTIWFTARSQREQAQVAFELKVAELAMAGSKDGYALKNKAEALKVMFGERLPPDFATHLQHKGFGFGSSNDKKIELLKLLAEKVPNEQAILRAWMNINPWDDWIAEDSNGVLSLKRLPP
jgi:hypothetical protein